MELKKKEPWLDCDLIDLENEEWIDILGFDGIYNVSNLGRVKSIGRFVNTKNGSQKWIKEKIMKQNLVKSANVKLSQNGISKTFQVSFLVYQAFMRDKKNGEEVCHMNKNVNDNRLSNLKILTHSDSMQKSYDLGIMQDWGISQVKKKQIDDMLFKFGVYENGILIGKECYCCGFSRKLSDFYGNKGFICKTCSLKRSGVLDLGKLTDRINLSKNGLRYCSVCKKMKKLDSDFGNSKHGFLGKSNNCKECVKELNLKYRMKKKFK
jgi:hypothetical protein